MARKRDVQPQRRIQGTLPRAGTAERLTSMTVAIPDLDYYASG